MAKKKINPLDLLAAKQAKIKDAAKERAEQLKEPETIKQEIKPITKKKKDSNKGNKLIRVHNEIHEYAKFNPKRMALSDYVESLIDLAEEDKNVSWSGLKAFKTTPHSLEMKRTLFRVSPHHHEKAKFNYKRMKLQNYIETLVILDMQGLIKW